ncbi:methionyl-tRNA synthetase [Alicyclobacillus hesperidum URH17-3-68]|nr:methionyl-tRNA synthetase [Alicyclobacillus hesperidum URH17-3-68]
MLARFTSESLFKIPLAGIRIQFVLEVTAFVRTAKECLVGLDDAIQFGVLVGVFPQRGQDFMTPCKSGRDGDVEFFGRGS